MPGDNNRSIQRQIAKKVDIKLILSSNYIRSEGEWDPNFIETPSGDRISRINLIATLISKNDSKNPDNIILDDGTGKIPVRAFQNPEVLAKPKVGEIVLLIGRPREFNNEFFLVPEIIKTINNPKWIKLRKLELAILNSLEPETKQTTQYQVIKPSKPKPITMQPQKTVIEEKVKVEEIISNASEISDTDKIFNLIETLDKDEGADIEEVIEKSKIRNAEKILNSFLESGTIFELKPGRVKILK